MTDPRDAVLLDALCERYGYTRAEAEEAARYVEKLWAVRWLLESEQLTSERYSDFATATCRGRGAVDDNWHHADCVAMAAWEALDHPRGHATCGAAWDRGVLQSPFRVPPAPGRSLLQQMLDARRHAGID